MRHSRERRRTIEEPTASDWPILLLIVGIGLMLWGPIVMLFTRRW